MKFNENIFYYDGDKKIYHNRNELLHNSRHWIRRFYYYDKEFGQVQWTKEPIEDLSTLYAQRAQQIRDEFDHVILCYSGGVDSTNILETFYYNNIHIDEILLVGAFSQDSFYGSDENHNGDIYHNVYPTLKKLDLPNTKITVKDYSVYFNNPDNFPLIKEYGTDFALQLGPYTSVHTLFWHDLKHFLGRKDEKKTCYIMGSDKPKMSIDAGKHLFFTEFNDTAVADYGSNFVDENFQRVNFYTHPKAEVLMRKQLHIIMKYYMKNVILEKNMTHEYFNENYIDIINNLMYDLKNPLQFQSTKSVISCLSVRDMFMLENKNSEMFKIYKDATLKLDRYLAQSKRGYQTRPYYISEQPIKL
jgi:hypothetical protein